MNEDGKREKQEREILGDKREREERRGRRARGEREKEKGRGGGGGKEKCHGKSLGQIAAVRFFSVRFPSLNFELFLFVHF